MNKRVSIIIPCFNQDKYLQECIESCVNQIYGNIEVIVIDDGSTDQSHSIAKKNASASLKVIHQNNRGPSAARNLGLENAQGDFIQYLDADDFLSHNKISEQIVLIGEAEKKVAVCPTVYFENNDQRLEKDAQDDWFLQSSDRPVDFLINLWGGGDFRGGMIQTNSWLVPRRICEQAGRWNEEIIWDEDGEYFARVVLASDGVVVAQNAKNYVRKHSSNISSVVSKEAVMSRHRALQLKEKYLFAASQDSRARKALAKCYFSIARNAYDVDKNLYSQIMKEVFDVYPDFKPDESVYYNLVRKILGYRGVEFLTSLKRRVIKRFNNL